MDPHCFPAHFSCLFLFSSTFVFVTVINPLSQKEKDLLCPPKARFGICGHSSIVECVVDIRKCLYAKVVLSDSVAMLEETGEQMPNECDVSHAEDSLCACLDQVLPSCRCCMVHHIMSMSLSCKLGVVRLHGFCVMGEGFGKEGGGFFLGPCLWADDSDASSLDMSGPDFTLKYPRRNRFLQVLLKC